MATPDRLPDPQSGRRAGNGEPGAAGGRVHPAPDHRGPRRRPKRRVPPVLLVHGGAWSIPGPEIDAHESGVRKALAAGYALLNEGASAVDAVETAVAALEDDEAFDAGRGSFLNRDGRVQLDALLMDGATLRAGGVACVERLKNPIHAARLVMEKSPHVYLVGAGADQFAREHGMAWIKNSELVIDRERRRLKEARRANNRPNRSSDRSHDAESHGTESHDTVGAIALDAGGNLAAATSTGGTFNKIPGRVGDSSLIGCGCYADNQSAAASLTGWGEPIMRLVLGKWACDRVQQLHPPEEAAQEAMGYLRARLQGHGGIILLDRAGRFGIAHNTPRMPWGVCDQRGIHTGTKI